MGRGSPNQLFRRLLSSAIGIPLLLLIIRAGTPWLTIVVMIVAILGLKEVYALLSTLKTRPLPIAGICWAVVLIGSSFMDWPHATQWIIGIGALIVLVMSLINNGPKSAFTRWIATSGGALYLGLPLTYAVLLRESDQGFNWLLFAVLCTFVNDTSAYTIGRLLGRHKIAPIISPSKSWEGAIGGLLGCIIASIAFAQVLELPYTIFGVISLGASIAIFAQCGDLIESKLKRQAQVKESGQLIPGHGGLLDRLDSLVFVMPLVYHVTRIAPGA